MKKILASLTLGALLLPMAALAQPSEGEIPWDSGAVVDTINVLVDWLFYILIFAAVIVILLAAFTFLTSAGDPDKVKKARDYILYALIALVIAFLARAIVMWIVEKMGA